MGGSRTKSYVAFCVTFNAVLVVRWRFGIAVTRCLDQRSCSTSSPVSTGMGDCLRVGKLSHYVTSHPDQLSLAIPP